MRDTNGQDVEEMALRGLRRAIIDFDEALDQWAEYQEITGGYLAETRSDKGVSMCSQARAMGISQPYLSLLERGKRSWTEALITRFVAALEKVTP